MEERKVREPERNGQECRKRETWRNDRPERCERGRERLNRDRKDRER